MLATISKTAKGYQIMYNGISINAHTCIGAVRYCQALGVPIAFNL